LSLLNASIALAATPHENPETATPVFSAIALFRYYSYSLDSILLKDAVEAEAKLAKLPWANVPQSLETATEDFGTSGINLAQLVVEIDGHLSQLKVLREESRVDEAAQLAIGISANLTEARSELGKIEESVTTAGSVFNVPSSPEGSDLKISYQEVWDRINRIREMLNLSGEVLVNELQGMKPTGGELPERTEITLSVEPMTALVGDNVSFEGTLTSGQEPLGERDVDILLNSSAYVTVQTDASGRYQGVLQLPYWYRSELDVQALYYPRRGDIGLYYACLSPVVKVKVLFYPATLQIKPEAKAYPGRETSVSIRYDYGDAPVPEARQVEIYFDDRIVTRTTAPVEFVQGIQIDPDTSVGKHTLTVSSAAAGRYAPAVGSIALEVTKAATVLDMHLPRVTLMPGVLNLKGKIYSELGPLSDAQVKLAIGKSQVELTTQKAGDFETKIRLGMSLGLVGSQDLAIQILPSEPWHEPLVITKPLLVVNVVNCAGVLVILIVLGVYLPSRLTKRLGVYAPRKAPPPTPPELPQPLPVVSRDITDGIPEGGQESGDPRRQVVYWYHFVTGLLARMAKAVLKPQQTLREFSQECSRILGPAANYFMALTKILERIIYSDYQPTAEDAEQSKQLSLTIREKLKG
jgi:hypothetical protein